jgi:hypothetical protein
MLPLFLCPNNHLISGSENSEISHCPVCNSTPLTKAEVVTINVGKLICNPIELQIWEVELYVKNLLDNTTHIFEHKALQCRKPGSGHFYPWRLLDFTTLLPKKKEEVVHSLRHGSLKIIFTCDKDNNIQKIEVENK